jgi:hypothetical protein
VGVGKRKPLDGSTAIADATDYLLRNFKKQNRVAGVRGDYEGPPSSESSGVVAPTLYVASVDELPWIKERADYVCDGVDDDIEIMAAVYELMYGPYAYGEGRVQLGGGAFSLGDYLFPEFIEIAGLGWNQTYLTFNNSTRYNIAESAVDISQSIRDLSIWVSTTTAPTPESGLYLHGSQAVATDVAVWYQATDPSATADAAVDISEGRLVNCKVFSSDVDLPAVWVRGSNRRTNAVLGCNVQGGKDGILVETDNVLLGSNFIVSPDQDGVHLAATSSKTLVGMNEIYDAGRHGVYIASTDGLNQVGMNVIENPVTDGIHLTSATNDDVIGPNLITGAGGSAIVDNGTNTILIPATATAADVSPLTTKGDLWGFDTVDDRVPIGADGTVLVADDSAGLGLKWDTQGGIETEVWGWSGAITTGTGAARLYTPVAMEIIDFRISLSAGTATVDAQKDGTPDNLFTTQGNRPIISSGNVSSLAVPDVTSVAADSWITIDVDAASSAEDLIVTMRWRKA